MNGFKKCLAFLPGLILLVTLSMLLQGCETTAPKNGTMQDIETVLEKVPPKTPAQPTPPPSEVSAALVPSVPVSVPKANRKFQEKRFDVNVVNIPTGQFLMGLVEGTPYNMVVHPDVQGAISLSLKSVTIPDVMTILRDVYGYEYQAKASGYQVMPKRLQSQIFQVNYLNMKRSGISRTRVSSGQVSESAGENSGSSGSGSSSSGKDKDSITSGSQISTVSETDFWGELSIALQAIVGNGEGRSVVISPHSGIVVVRAMPLELREVGRFLETTNLSLHRQVILEAKILEVELGDAYQAGINWAKMMTINGNPLTLGQTGGSQPFQGADQGGIDFPTGGITDPGVTSPADFASFEAFGGFFGGVISTGSFAAFIELLESQGNVQVLSSPRVSTLNNQKAVIKVGTDEFFVTDISTTTVTGTATTVSPDVTLTPFFSGIALDVTPQIDQYDRVTLHIHPSVSQVDDQQKTIEVGGETQSLPLAKSTVRESDSMVFAESGQLVVIGGLMQNKMGEEQTSTPWLGDIPGIGPLFRHTRQGSKKSELVILIKPTVVKGQSTWDDQLKGTADRFERLERGFHFGSRPEIFGNEGEPRWEEK